MWFNQPGISFKMRSGVAAADARGHITQEGSSSQDFTPKMEHSSVKRVSLLSAPARDFIAGGVGGMVGIAASQPLDTIRIRLQQKGNEYAGVIGALRSMATSREGVLSVYKGMAYPLCSATLQAAVTFWSFGSAMRFIHGKDYERSEVPGYTSVIWSGACAGAVQSLVVTPVELLKIRLQVQKAVKGDKDYAGPIKMFAKVVEDHGFKGLFRGLGITAIRDIPAYGGYFFAYYTVKDYIDPPFPGKKTEDESKSAMMVAGAVAGLASWCAYPADVVKSRIQIYDNSNSPYRNWYDCGVKAVKGEGWKVLFRGLYPSLWHGIVASCAIFLTYEASMSVLEKW